MVSFSNMARELVEEIMSWLPPTCLMRAKCVCKSWNALITALVNDEEFVTRHLHNMKRKPSRSLVFNPSGPNARFKLLTLFNDDVCDGDIHSVAENFYVPLLQGESYIAAHHCNGIICLVKDFFTLMICNPALQEFKLLPESELENVTRFDSQTGFGYDPRVKDYKLVRIVLCLLGVRAEVYTLGTDSWREIHVSHDIKICFSCCRALYWRGICYWVIFDASDGEKKKILCFDMSSEEFHIMPGPNNMDQAHWIGIRVWNDSLALLLCPLETDSLPSLESDSDDPDQLITEICVMVNCFSVDGVKGTCSWAESVRMTSPLGIVDAFTFWKSDEFLFKDGHGDLVSYNLHTKKLRNVATHGVGWIGTCACSYMTSLVSVGGR